MTRSPRYDCGHTLLAKTRGGVAGVSPAEGVVAYFPSRGAIREIAAQGEASPTKAIFRGFMHDFNSTEKTQSCSLDRLMCVL